MSDQNQNNSAFQNSGKSRRRVKRQKPWLAVPLAVLVILFAVALFFAVKHAIGKWGGSPTPSESAQSAQTTEPATDAPEKTEAPTTEKQSSTSEAETEAESREIPSQTQSEASGTPAQTEPAETKEPETEQPSSQEAGAFHLYTAAELLPVPEEISRSFFEDINASDSSGSWWFGSMVRNLETGVVVKGYDRSASTLGLIGKYQAIYRKNEDQKLVYLTFDCGYEYGYTGMILDTLKEKNVQAVFFVAGDFVNDSKNADLLRRMYEEGHVIGSHTDHHPVMPLLTDEEFIDEQNNLQLKVNAMLGRDYQIRFYRPPQGSCSERDLYLAGKMGLTTVFWSYAYGDYDTQNQMEVSAALEKAEKGLHDGCVYLLHAVSSTNAAMLGDLIDYIRNEGYEIRRIDQ